MQSGYVLQTPGFIQNWRLHSIHLVLSDTVISVDEVVTELVVQGTDPGVLLVASSDLVNLVLEFFQTWNNQLKCFKTVQFVSEINLRWQTKLLEIYKD